MKIALCCLLLTISVTKGFSQTICVDPSRTADPYFQCNSPQYEPVCGCDAITYRNRCAAENWGGLINNGFDIGWIEGTVCGNFDFDILPTAVEYFPMKLSIFVKSTGSATFYVYTQYGGMILSDYFSFNYPGQIQSREYDLSFLELGIYFAVVVVNGESVTRKFGKVSPNTN